MGPEGRRDGRQLGHTDDLRHGVFRTADAALTVGVGQLVRICRGCDVAVAAELVLVRPFRCRAGHREGDITLTLTGTNGVP